MIIACYAGVGKSTFAERYPEETLDLASMPFSWILPEKCEGEFEDVKAAPYLLRNPAFCKNYIAAVLEAEQTYKYVLIPTIYDVLLELRKRYQAAYILCYPHIGLKEEYRGRYIARGNTDDFIDIFITQWDDRIGTLMRDGAGRRIVLGAGQFLTDVKSEIDSIISETVNVGRNDAVQRKSEIADLKKQTEITMRNGCICLIRYDDIEHYFPHHYFKLDLCDPDNRKWLFELGRTYHRKDVRIDTDDFQWLETFYDHEYGSDPDKIREFGSRQEVIDFLESISDSIR